MQIIKWKRNIGFIVLAVIFLLTGCNMSSKSQSVEESDQSEFTSVLSYLNETKDQLLETFDLSEEDLELQMPLLYRVNKVYSFDGKEYYPWLEFADDTNDAQLVRYGFCFTELTPEETLATAQKLVETISVQFDLKNVPAANMFKNSEQAAESNTKGISGITYKELEKWDTYELTEVWNKEKFMYFKAEMVCIPFQEESNTILIRIAYVPEGYPAFLGEAL